MAPIIHIICCLMNSTSGVGRLRVCGGGINFSCRHPTSQPQTVAELCMGFRRLHCCSYRAVELVPPGMRSSMLSKVTRKHKCRSHEGHTTCYRIHAGAGSTVLGTEDPVEVHGQGKRTSCWTTPIMQLLMDFHQCAIKIWEKRPNMGLLYCHLAGDM